MNVGQILETHLGWAAKVLGLHFASPVFDGATEKEIKELPGAGQRARAAAQPAAAEPAGERQDHADRRHDRRALRAEGDGRLHLHAEAQPPGRRQDPRPLHRAVLADHAAAAGRQGAVRRPALRRDGGLGARGVRRRPHPAGAAHGQVRRRLRPRQDLRGDRQGRHGLHARACPSRSTS